MAFPTALIPNPNAADGQPAGDAAAIVIAETALTTANTALIEAESAVASTHLLILATEDIPAFEVITSDGRVANSNDFTTFGQSVGVVDTFVPNGNIAMVSLFETFINPGWSFTPGAIVYLNGTQLSTTPPTVGWLQQIGLAVNDHSMVIQVGVAVTL